MAQIASLLKLHNGKLLRLANQNFLLLDLREINVLDFEAEVYMPNLSWDVKVPLKVGLVDSPSSAFNVPSPSSTGSVLTSIDNKEVI